MLHSKQVIFKDEAPQSWLQKIVDWWEGTWLGYRLYILRERICRSWAFAVYAWDNYDFDASYALELLSFKLKRVQNVLINKTHLVQEPEHMQALKLVIRLLDRLRADNYSYFYERHNKKWFGEPHPGVEFEPIPNSDCSRAVCGRDNLPADQQEQEAEEIRAAFAADDAIKARDKRWAFEILAKYYEYWWD